MKKNLIQGIGRFQTEIFKEKWKVFKRLSEGQEPHTLLITCSDSRIQPDVITGAEPGELFILRNVGNIVPQHGNASVEAEAVIEYATLALGVRDIIVCGHSHCGAMKALLEPESLDELPTVAAWLTHAEETRARVARKYSHLQGDDLHNAAIRENVLVQMERVESLPSVKPRVADGRIKVHGWVYQIDSGEVFHYRKDRDSFDPITAAEVASELAS